MNMLIQLASLLACLGTVSLLPIQEDEAFGGNFDMRLAKRPFYPYREALLSPFGYFENPRERSQGQRKKAVDSTFIRFGRSSPVESRNVRNLQGISASMERPTFEDIEVADNAAPDSDGFKVSGQRFVVNHNGCRISNSQELMKALLSDPNCIRAFQKAKRENVNDTFIRFGKREAPPEDEKPDPRISSNIGER